MPNLDPADFPDLESVSITIVEETPDGKRYVTVYGSLEDIPEIMRASVGSEEERAANALNLAELVRKASAEARESAQGEDG